MHYHFANTRVADTGVADTRIVDTHVLTNYISQKGFLKNRLFKMPQRPLKMTQFRQLKMTRKMHKQFAHE